MAMFSISFLTKIFLHLLVSIAAEIFGNETQCNSQPAIHCTEKVGALPSCYSEALRHYVVLENCFDVTVNTYLNSSYKQIQVHWTYTVQVGDKMSGFLLTSGISCHLLLFHSSSGLSAGDQLNFTTTVHDNDVSQIGLTPVLSRSQQDKTWNRVMYLPKHSGSFDGEVDVVIETMKRVSEYVVELMNSTCDSNPIQYFTVFQSKITFHNLTFGTYCIRIRPIDPHPMDRKKCACFTGSSTCRLCLDVCSSSVGIFSIPQEHVYSVATHDPISTHDAISSHDSISSVRPENPSEAPSIVGNVVGGVGSVLLIFTIITVMFMKNLHYMCLRKICQLSVQNVVILTADDSECHVTLVNCLAECLEKHCSCRVINPNVSDTGTFKCFHQLSSAELQKLECSENVIVIHTQNLEREHSKWVKERFAVSRDDENMFYFLKKMVESKQCKLVAVLYFSEKSRRQLHKPMNEGSHFLIMEEFNQLISYLHSTTCSSLIYRQKYERVLRTKEFELLRTSIMKLEGEKENRQEIKSVRKSSLRNVDSGNGGSIIDGVDSIQGLSFGYLNQQNSERCVSGSDVKQFFWIPPEEDNFDSLSNEMMKINMHYNMQFSDECISLGGQSV